MSTQLLLLNQQTIQNPSLLSVPNKTRKYLSVCVPSGAGAVYSREHLQEELAEFDEDASLQLIHTPVFSKIAYISWF